VRIRPARAVFVPGAQNSLVWFCASVAIWIRLLAVSRQVSDLNFAPLKLFSFFMWGEIRRVSPHGARASPLWLASSCVVVRRNCLNFAPGVGQNPLGGEAKFVRPPAFVLRCAKFSGVGFGHLSRFGHRPQNHRSARTLSAGHGGLRVDEMPKNDSRPSLAAWPSGSGREE
jgi:hypothetical protein